MIEIKPQRVKISCQGDVRVTIFSCPEKDNGPYGTERILLEEGEKGEIGRRSNDLDPVDLSTCQGVLIGCTDPRSCEVFIEAFQEAMENLCARMMKETK
jgi:hypothetical protein